MATTAIGQGHLNTAIMHYSCQLPCAIAKRHSRICKQERDCKYSFSQKPCMGFLPGVSKLFVSGCSGVRSDQIAEGKGLLKKGEREKTLACDIATFLFFPPPILIIWGRPTLIGKEEKRCEVVEGSTFSCHFRYFPPHWIHLLPLPPFPFWSH